MASTAQQQLENIRNQALQVRSGISTLRGAEQRGLRINPNTTVQQAQSFLGGVPSPIQLSTLTAPTRPYNLPTPVPSPTITPSVAPPTGTTPTATGGVTITPPVPAQTTRELIMQKYKEAGDTLATQSQVTQDLQKEQQLARKTEQATQDYNRYIQAKTDWQNQLEQQKRNLAAAGGSASSINSSLAEYERKGNANLANLAVQAQVSQGLLDAAQQTIQDKLDAQFKPIQDQIDYYSKFIQLNNADLTDKERFQLQEEADKKKADLTIVTNTTEDLHQELLKNRAPQSAYTALDKISEDFNSGKITAQQASSQMYQAASRYGVDSGVSGEAPLYSGLNPATATAVRSVVGGFKSEPIVTNFAQVQDGYNLVQSLSNTTTNPTDDQALIYSLAKVLDPGSVVREGEYATAQKYSQSWADAYGKGVTQAINGTGFLSEQARKNIKATIKSKYVASKRSYDNLYNQYAGQINNLTGRDDGTKFLRDYSTPMSVEQPAPVQTPDDIFDSVVSSEAPRSSSWIVNAWNGLMSLFR